MSWISRLFSRGERLPVEQVADAIERIAKGAASIHEYREALKTAAARGDLDGAFRRVSGANKRAADYIEKG